MWSLSHVESENSKLRKAPWTVEPGRGVAGGGGARARLGRRSHVPLRRSRARGHGLHCRALPREPLREQALEAPRPGQACSALPHGATDVRGPRPCHITAPCASHRGVSVASAEPGEGAPVVRGDAGPGPRAGGPRSTRPVTRLPLLQVAIIAGNFELAEYIKSHKETDVGEWARAGAGRGPTPLPRGAAPLRRGGPESARGGTWRKAERQRLSHPRAHAFVAHVGAGAGQNLRS